MSRKREINVSLLKFSCKTWIDRATDNGICLFGIYLLLKLSLNQNLNLCFDDKIEFFEILVFINWKVAETSVRIDIEPFRFSSVTRRDVTWRDMIQSWISFQT